MPYKNKKSQPLSRGLKQSSLPLFMGAFLAISGCANPPAIFDPNKHDFIDRPQELNREDYRNMPMPKGAANKGNKFAPYLEGDAISSLEVKEAPIPDVTTILATPRPPAIGQTQLVSIFVTEDVPLKDVLIELSRLANVDVEIDAGIQGGIVFRAQNRPFNEVIERISALAGLRYEMKNGVLRVERDTQLVKTYPLDFLSFSRSSTSDVNISTSVLSSSGGGGGGGGSGGGGGGGGGGGMNSGSSAAITYSAESDFWERFGEGVDSILKSAAQHGSVTAGAASGGAQGGGSAQETMGDSFHIVNRQGGTLTVSGTSRQHSQIEQYINQLRETTSAQVLIEAKIVEVNLDDQYASGINWNQVLRGKVFAIDADYASPGVVGGLPTDLTQILIGGTSPTDNLDAIVSLTQQFGTTRTLSSPRIHAMNNQQAVLTFAQNLVYFDISVERETDNTVGGSQELFTVDAEAVTVPIGIIISLQPAINTRTGEITLSIRPTLSRTNGSVSDPSVAFVPGAVAAGLENLIPIVEVREMDSLMRMKSGQIMILGGLMEQVGTNNDAGVPFVSGIPWIGNAFKSVSKREQVRELFILVKATIVGNTTNVDSTDREIYNKFTGDHRPLAF